MLWLTLSLAALSLAALLTTLSLAVLLTSLLRAMLLAALSLAALLTTLSLAGLSLLAVLLAPSPLLLWRLGRPSLLTASIGLPLTLLAAHRFGSVLAILPVTVRLGVRVLVWVLTHSDSIKATAPVACRGPRKKRLDRFENSRDGRIPNHGLRTR